MKLHSIDMDKAQEVVTAYLEAGVYTAIYSLDDYFVQKSQQSDLTEAHTYILQRKPQLAVDLVNQITTQPIVKIIPVAKNEADKQHLTKLFKPFEDDLTLSWGVHRFALPHQFGIITQKGISKQQAALEIAQYGNIKKDEMLGTGDSTSDWQYIEDCGYATTVANGSAELKKLVSGKGPKSFIGGSVDENSILEIFDYFRL